MINEVDMRYAIKELELLRDYAVVTSNSFVAIRASNVLNALANIEVGHQTI